MGGDGGDEADAGGSEQEGALEAEAAAEIPEGPVDLLAVGVGPEAEDEDVPAQLQLAHAAVGLQEGDLAGDAYKAACHYVRDKVHIGNLAAESSFLGASRTKLRGERTLAAGLLTQLEKQAWAHIERAVVAHKKANAGVRLRCYVEAFMFDGVDLSVATRRQADLGNSYDVPLEPELSPEERLEAVRDLEDHLSTLPLLREQGPAKLLNSQHCASMLISVDHRHLVLEGETVTWLQVLDRNTGETVRRALAEICMTNEDARGEFERVIRVSMSDSAGYNLRAEKHSRDASVSRIHLLCDAHIVAGVHQKVNSLLSVGISGMVKASLSLQGGGTISVFRRCLRRVLARDLVLIRDRPSADAMAYKEAMMDLFLGDKLQNAQVRAVVGRCASGDWRRRGRFEYLATGAETRAEVLKLLYTHLVPAIVGHAPRTFPQHRWTGADLALQDYGLLCLIHDLFGSAYREFMENFGGLEQHPQPGEDDVGMEGEGDAGRLGEAGIGQEDLRYRDAKRHYRGAAWQWASSPVRDRDLVLAATVVRPMNTYMVQEIAAAAAISMTKATHERLQTMLATGNLKGFLESARWPLLEAALGAKDRTALNSIAALDDPACYSAWPEDWYTVATRTKLFKCLSRQAAAIHELLATKHKACPYMVFRLISDPAAAQAELDGTCRSAMDDFTTGFLEAYPDELCSEPAMLELAMVLMHARTSTVSLESSNASVRRRLHGASLQVVMPDLHAISAEFALGKLRRRQLERKCPPGHREHRGKVKQRRQNRKRKRGGAGGAYRAFVHSRGQKISKELNDEWRALTAVAKAAFIPAGRHATARSALGIGDFRTKSRVSSSVCKPCFFCVTCDVLLESWQLVRRFCVCNLALNLRIMCVCLCDQLRDEHPTCAKRGYSLERQHLVGLTMR